MLALALHDVAVRLAPEADADKVLHLNFSLCISFYSLSLSPSLVLSFLRNTHTQNICVFVCIYTAIQSLTHACPPSIHTRAYTHKCTLTHTYIYTSRLAIWRTTIFSVTKMQLTIRMYTSATSAPSSEPLSLPLSLLLLWPSIIFYLCNVTINTIMP